MNTRIQVEHGVTEELTGVDLVAEQLRIAFGDPIGVKQDEIVARGAVIELRLNAENPKFHFFGSPGVVAGCTFPAGPGVRIDSGVVSGSVIQPHYDSMVTTLGFLDAVLATDWCRSADFHTGTIDETLPELLRSL